MSEARWTPPAIVSRTLRRLTIQAPGGRAGRALVAAGLLAGTVVAVGLGVGVSPAPAGAQGEWVGPTQVDYNSGGIADESCASSSFCMEVDGSGDYATYDGSSWTSPTNLTGAAPGLTSVSCTSSSFCMAGDVDGDIWEYSGNPPTWSSVELGQADNEIESLSCTSTNFCAAVTADGDGLVYDGSWSGGQVDPGVQINSVSCAVEMSSATCVAVDDDGGYLVYDQGSESWSGPNPIGTGAQTTSVSCPSVGFCVAVDGYGNADVYQNGSWTYSLVDTSGNLESVSCTSSSFCVAVDGQGYAFVYDGSWTPSRIDSNPLTVSCAPASSFCVAGDTAGQVLTYDANAMVISNVTFYGTSEDPFVVVTGNGFGSEPAPQPAGCSSGGYDYGVSGLTLDYPGQWEAGSSGNCIGLYVSVWTNTEVVFGVGDAYYTYYQGQQQYTPLTDGNSYLVTVNSYVSSGTILFSSPPGVTTTYTCTTSSESGLPSSSQFPVSFSETPSPSSPMPVGASFSPSYQVVATIPSSYVGDAQADGVQDIVIDGMSAEVDATTPGTGAMSPSTNTSQATNLPLVLALGAGTNPWAGPGDTIFDTTYSPVTWTAATPGTVDFTPSTLVISVTGTTTGGNLTASYSCSPTGGVTPIDTTTVVPPASSASYQASAFAQQDEVTPGNDGGWVLEVSNTSTAAVTGLKADISATDSGPALSFDLSAMAKGGTHCTANGSGTISCTIGTLGAGATDDLYPLVQTTGLTEDTTISGTADLNSSNAGEQSATLGAIDVEVVPNGALAVASPGVAVDSTTSPLSSSVPAKVVLKLPKYKIRHHGASLAVARVVGATSAPATVSSPAPVSLSVESSTDDPGLCPSSCDGAIADVQVTGNTADYTNPEHPVTAVITIYFGSSVPSGAAMWVQETNGTVEQLPTCIKGSTGYNVPCLKGRQKTVGTSGNRSLEDTVDFIAGPEDPAFGIR